MRFILFVVEHMLRSPLYLTKYTCLTILSFSPDDLRTDPQCRRDCHNDQGRHFLPVCYDMIHNPTLYVTNVHTYASTVMYEN